MNGTGLGIVNVATGFSLLPDMGNDHPLFMIAAGLILSGVVILTISTAITRKSRKKEA
jgi:hypothetical protein